MVKLIGAFAPAKINLFLRVTGRRADGYHELDSIFVPITIGDRVAIRGAEENLLEAERDLFSEEGDHAAVMMGDDLERG